MQKLKIGDRVRFIGQSWGYKNPVLLMLVNRTGVIESISDKAEADWFVRMDEGVIDIDAKSEVLEKIEPHEAGNFEAREVCEQV